MNNTNKIWFKRKLYGWGWTPSTWQGWLITSLYIVLIILGSLFISRNTPSQESLVVFVVSFVALTISFIAIAYKKGEKPRWQWGVRKDDLINK